MSYRGRRAGDAGGGVGREGAAVQRSPGKRTLTDGLAPRPADYAQAALDTKGSGEAVDGEVRRTMEGQLGVDLGAVRVHSDERAALASGGLGARAFAHQSDVFLGRGESPSDLALMGHELTHVAQQGAAGEAATQRQVAVGAQDAPAEREADAISQRAVAGEGPVIIADDATPRGAQLRRAEFLERLLPAIVAAAQDALGPLWSAAACPTIEAWFARNAATDAAALDRMARRFSGFANPAGAGALIPAIVGRVTAAIRREQAGEDVSADLALVGMTPATAGVEGTAEPAAVAGAGAAGVQAKASPETQPLDASTVSRMGGALGDDLSDVRVHTGPMAARRAADEGAAAFAVGTDVYFGAGQYQPGTVEGDALIAHELAHVVQQRGATGTVQRSAGEALEDDADQAATGVLARIYGGAKAAADRVGPAMKSGLALQRCTEDKKKTADPKRKAAHDLLVRLDGLGDTDFRREVGAMTRDQTTELLANASTADKTTYATLIKRIKDERLVSTAEGDTGDFYWAGNSGADPTDGYQIKTATTRRHDRSLIDPTLPPDTNTNHFALWVRGGAEPTDAQNMNCWEVILFVGYKAGVIAKQWIVDLHTRAAGAGAAVGNGTGVADPGMGAYQAEIAAGLNLAAASAWTSGSVIPRGNLVFFDDLAHVALSRGSKNGAGEMEIMSLWHVPPKSTLELNSTYQATTIEAVIAGGGQLPTMPGFSPAVKHGPNPW